jgi:KRAB domain-containing zinc finger protein
LKEEHNITLNIELVKNTRSTVRHFNRDRRYNCQYCDRSYIGLASLSKHTALHGTSGTLIHKCSCCTKYFATEEGAEAHQLQEHLEKLECQFCQKRFKDPDATNAHIRHSHSDQKDLKKNYFMCNMCGKNFNSRTAVSDHERSNCGQTPLYKCDVCDKHYHSAGSLKTHRGLHEDSLPFICKYCGKRWADGLWCGFLFFFNKICLFVFLGIALRDR